MSIRNPREIRLRLGLNQTVFWSGVGVTQTTGSRYENDREMPRWVEELVRVIYVERIDLAKIRRGDMAVLAYLKKVEPALYRRLRAAARKKSR